jgi:hypothetical protein
VEQSLRGLREIGARVSHAAGLLAQVERRDGRFDVALDALDAALAAGPAPRDWRTAQLLWRRAVLHLDRGRPNLATADEGAARDILAGEELYLLELLGCLVAEALVVEESDPTRSARLLGSVQAHLGPWTLPFDLDDDAARLAHRLTGSFTGEVERGRGLEPVAAAMLDRY